MTSDSKKIGKITDHALNLITDIRDKYVKEYHLEVNEWDDGLKQLYFLNCDMEILRFLEKNKIEANHSAVSFGLSYGMLILKNQIACNYNERYSEECKSLEIKDKMYSDINMATRDFIINGV